MPKCCCASLHQIPEARSAQEEQVQRSPLLAAAGSGFDRLELALVAQSAAGAQAHAAAAGSGAKDESAAHHLHAAGASADIGTAGVTADESCQPTPTVAPDQCGGGSAAEQCGAVRSEASAELV